ncbi:hypothetical protein NED98_18575 [Sphingomonas sp. MMSM20]|uniref:hypothetical protein n=1 Tax=Sphingomonas lycopersici TaxID=2951807 RepID=UPI0022378CB5|nr:hypothetical protein [Sphingomonas lycopersici]MCW6532258.1 hypothetical protein [Sphingomonas lycopersici]
MNDSEYRGGLGAGGSWGCALAAVIGLPVLIALSLVDSLGDCAPDTNCHKSFFWNAALPAAIVVLIVFAVVRLVARTFGRGD